MSSSSKSIYDQVVDVTYEYFGPAAQRFVDREVEFHLGKKPSDLTKDDIAKLHDWSKLAVALLAEDDKTINDFSQDLLSIAEKKGR